MTGEFLLLREAILGRNDQNLEELIKGLSPAVLEEVLKEREEGHDRDGDTLLHVACDQGTVPAVTRFLLAGADPDAANNHGVTPLHMATLCRDDGEMAEVLIAKGAKIDPVDEEGDTPLLIACAFLSSLQVANTLVEKGANVKAVNTKSGKTVLHQLFCQPGDVSTEGELVRSLLGSFLSKGVDIKASDLEEKTALHYAAERGLAELLGILLDVASSEGVSVDVDAADKEKHTAAYYACSRGNEKVLDLLLKAGAKVSAIKNEDYTLLHAVCDFTVELYCVKGESQERVLSTDVERTVFDTADSAKEVLKEIKRRHQAVLEKLLSENNDIDLDARAGGDQTPLHIAFGNGHCELAEALLRAGADLNALSEERKTPLMVAWENGRDKMIEQIADRCATAIEKKTQGWEKVFEDDARVTSIMGCFKEDALRERSGYEASRGKLSNKQLAEERFELLYRIENRCRRVLSRNLFQSAEQSNSVPADPDQEGLPSAKRRRLDRFSFYSGPRTDGNVPPSESPESSINGCQA